MLSYENGKPVSIKLNARIDRGFDEEDGEWICYRRNYMSLCAAFDVVEHIDSGLQLTPRYPSSQIFISNDPDSLDACLYFVLRVEARVCGSESLATLVQHTAKRNPGSQTEPSDVVLFPGKLPPHTFIRDSANVRCPSKLERIFNTCHITARDQRGFSPGQKVFLKHYPGLEDSSVAQVARFERLQFQFIQRCRRESCKYRLRVILLAKTARRDDLVEIASSYTPEVVVRGRSPASYTASPKTPRARTTRVTREPSLSPTLLEEFRDIYAADKSLDGELLEVPSSPFSMPHTHQLSLPDLSQSLSETETESEFSSGEDAGEVALLMIKSPPQLSASTEIKIEGDTLEEFVPQLTFDTAGFALCESVSEVSFDLGSCLSDVSIAG